MGEREDRKQLLAFVGKDHQFLLRDSSITDWLFVVSDLTYLCDDCNASSCAFNNFQNAQGQPFATAAEVCAGSKCWWTVGGGGVMWVGEEPSTTGVNCCGWFDGTWIIFDGTNVFLFRRQPLL